MSVNLQKGQKADLRKSDGGQLTKVLVGLGWDEAGAQESGGFFRSLFKKTSQDIDCDASAFLCKNGRLTAMGDIVYFGNLTHDSGAVQHMGDNLTGAGEGDDEQITVDLTRLPPDYDKIVFVVNIYQARQRHQHFGMISNAFIRRCDDRGAEMCKDDLSENDENRTAMVFGEMYRKDGSWKFNAIGQPTTDNDIASLSSRFK